MLQRQSMMGHKLTLRRTSWLQWQHSNDRVAEGWEGQQSWLLQNRYYIPGSKVVAVIRGMHSPSRITLWMEGGSACNKAKRTGMCFKCFETQPVPCNMGWMVGAQRVATDESKISCCNNVWKFKRVAPSAICLIMVTLDQSDVVAVPTGVSQDGWEDEAGANKGGPVIQPWV
ncbi:hypothetical protein F5887DRAFT_921201 [Amanita rubescens]|nr:hypothetical protein F5887DRAFT_921201 [Amanita rubescens]